MALTNTSSITAVLVASAGQTVFAYNFPILLDTDLEVNKDLVVQTLTTDYSVTGVGNDAGGTVVFVTPMTGGEEVVIRRVPSFTQETEYTETSKFPAASHEQALDKLTMLAQTLKETDERTPKWESGIDKTTVSAMLPNPVTNAGKVLGLAATGLTPVTILASDIVSPVSTKGDLLGYTTAPAAKAVGANDTLLVADSTDSFGWNWKTVASSLDTVATTRGDILKVGSSTTERMALIAYDEQYGSDGTDLVAKKIPWTQGQCRLAKSGAALVLSPYNGNNVILKTGSVWNVHRVPSGGVSLSITSETAGNLYYIYLYNNSGTLTLESSTTAYTTETTFGFTVKSSDSTRLLVGMAYVITGDVFADTITQRYVRSWYNDSGVSGTAHYAADTTTASATFVEIDATTAVGLLTWLNEEIIFNHSGSWELSLNSATVYSAIGIDSTTVATYGILREHFPSSAVGYPLSYTFTANNLTETSHIFHHLVKTSAGTLKIKGGTLITGGLSTTYCATGRK